MRCVSSARDSRAGEILFEGETGALWTAAFFEAERLPSLVVSAEICEDVWSPVPPSIQAAREGATVIVNCSASDETIGKDTYREKPDCRTVCPSDLPDMYMPTREKENPQQTWCLAVII